ncbi:DHS-like NAD/FAD-binding domain-containing protein [Tuber magnatum]|uniref:DHS-like NAD/FAD-binding domain-containing protein n=1 Tax=Tuber magnatum TaxID=42249 RepID=A0A317SNM1_9PEZI|nr:DHS-like NAD/FAD-binding domain-containing protein [Tuber magnatum]
MGAELSTQVDSDTPPETISRRDIPALMGFVLSGKCERIVFLRGAGISTSASTLDFRTPGTDLYSNLQILNLPHPEAVFDIKLSRTNPQPFYTLAKSLNPGQFTPTITRSFVGSAGGAVEAHGPFAGQSCIDCHAKYPADRMKKHHLTGSVPQCETCAGLVKPNIVFFGRACRGSFIWGLEWSRRRTW